MKNTLVTLLVIVFINLSFGGLAYSQTTDVSQNAAKIRSRITKIGKTRTVIVKLNDGSKIKGKITDLNDDNFLINAKQIRFDEVKRVSQPTPAWMPIVAVGSIVGIVALVVCAAKECGGLR